jgi:hypothetical protein
VTTTTEKHIYTSGETLAEFNAEMEERVLHHDRLAQKARSELRRHTEIAEMYRSRKMPEAT